MTTEFALRRFTSSTMPASDLSGQGASAGPLAPMPRRAVAADPLAEGLVECTVPTSEAQREIWLADRLSPEASLAFNESVSLRLSGPLDRRAMEGALTGLWARHDALRATIAANGTEMLVQSAARFTTGFADLGGLSATEGEQALERFTRDAVRTPFSLEHGPLLRALLCRLASTEHVVLITAHHIVCDGWSWGVMVEDLAALYAEQIGAAPSPDPAPRYGDYVAWEIALATSPERAADEAYWFSRFAGAVLPVLDLVPDRPRAAQRSFKASRIDHPLDAALLADVRKLGANLGVTLFASLFGAFALLLHRLTGQEDLVIGVPVAGQWVSGMTGLIGHCVNLLPVRVAADAGQPFDAFARVTSATLLDAFDHKTVTYGSLLKQLRVRRDASRLPLVSVMFNLDPGVDTRGGAFADLKVAIESNPRDYENFELFVNLVPQGLGLLLECQYNTDLFDASSIKRWLGMYESLLRAAVWQPGTPLARLNGLPYAERQALLALQRPRSDYPTRERMHSAFERQAVLSGERVAVRCGATQLNYAELNQRSNRLACALRLRGAKPGRRIGLCLPRSADMLVAMLAVLKSGAAYVPLDPSFPSARLNYCAADAQLALLVTQSGVSNAPLAWCDDAAERLFMLDQHTNELLSDARPPGADEPSAGPDDVAYVIYTSGSTGKPKGVAVPHRTVVNFLTSMAQEPGLKRDDVLAAVTTLSFDIAVLELMLPLSVGAQVLLVGRDTALDGTLLGQLLEETSATCLQATPALWRLLLDTTWCPAPGFKALVGGEALPSDLAKTMLARCAEVWNLYGPTETTVWSTAWKVDASTLAETGVSIGRPIANTTVWILDAVEKICPIGVAGELCIGGEGVSLGYVDRPELNGERFIQDTLSAGPNRKLYRTGDRARWRNDGLLEHLGRLDFQVKVRGYRIEPGEIEAVCRASAAVSQAVVIAREDRPGDVRLVAYVVLKAGAELDERTFTAQLRAQLPDYMIPQHVVVLDAIPLLPNRKIDRMSLPAPLSGAAAAGNTKVAPRDPIEQSVWQHWREVLGVDHIGVFDNFFELGGHSMLVVQLQTRLQAQFSTRVALNIIFQAPTIAQMAALLSGSAIKGLESLSLIRAGSGPVPIFFIHDGQGETLVYRTLAHRLRTEAPVYGLSPMAGNGLCMVHTRFAQLAAHYVTTIRAVQAQGPYVLGGLCAGAVIAFEVARQLQQQGETIATVLLLDATDVAAQPRIGRFTAGRIRAFSVDLAAKASFAHPLRTTRAVIDFAACLVRLTARQVGTRVAAARNRRRAAALQRCLDSGNEPPAALRALTVEQIYPFVEAGHVERGVLRGNVLLVRATTGNGEVEDEPFVNLYLDPMMGWSPRVEGQIECVDVPGGHYSMFQEPHVDALAGAVQLHVDAALGRKHA